MRDNPAHLLGDTVRCECGDTVPTEQATADLTPGVYLCPDCAAESTVPCTICGEDRPVRLYGVDGQDPRTTLGIGDYFAVCYECGHPEGAGDS